MRMDDDSNDIRVKTVFNHKVMVTYITPCIDLEGLRSEMREICSFPPSKDFIMKWIDEEGDPCILSTKEELHECLRLYDLNRDSEITIHVFSELPAAAGLPCPGEDKSIYRRGARRWKKLYKVNGHIFQAKRFSRKAFCAFCHDRIWGLGRQGFKCVNCKLMVHKKCHKLYKVSCGGVIVEPSKGRASPGSQGSGDGIQNHNNQQVNGHKFPPALPRVKTPRRSKTSLQGNDQVRRDPNAGSGRGSRIEDAKRTIDGAVSRSSSGQLVDENGHEEDDEIGSGPRQYCLSDFDLLRVIGRGSYAKVLVVELKRNKRLYAMKVIKKALVADEDDIDWVQTEKHVFEQATNYPFLVALHSCFQTASRLFFVIEFVKGGDLMFHMQRQRKLPEEHARFYAAEITLALNFLHERGIIYRDLKLDNVLLDHEGHIKLTDYGMCKEGIQPGGTTSTFCGTPNYIAPEILRGEDYDFSVDYWALGVLLYEMLAGRSPFDIPNTGDNPDQNTEDYLFQFILEKTIRIPRSISVKAQSVLKGFLNKNPIERLGCNPGTGFTDVQSHPFFRPIDWERLEAKQITPPYRPHIQSDYDLEHFDTQFTSEAVQLTPDDPGALDEIDQSEFDGFEYVNPLLMSLEDCV